MAQFVQGRPADRPICLHPESLGLHRDMQSCSQAPQQSHKANGHGFVNSCSYRRLVAGTINHSHRSQTRHKTIRVVMEHRLGGNTCELHNCICGKSTPHGLAWHKSAVGQQWHVLLNDIIWREELVYCTGNQGTH